MKLSSYPKIYNLGHKQIEDIFEDEVEITEKVDGSQFRFCVIDNEVHCFSKNSQINPADPQNLFAPAVATAHRLFSEKKLINGWIYCGEAVCRPRHNHLEYDRAPIGGVILFDIVKGDGSEDYLRHDQLKMEADVLGLEVVPLLHKGKINHLEELNLKSISCLGKATIEGVVIKNYTRFGRDGKPLFAKLVRDDFKETQKRQWKKDNPGQGDIVIQIIEALKTEARWNKSIQHLRDDGRLEYSMRDMPLLLKEIQNDTFAEEEEWIKEKLFKWAWPKIRGSIVKGFAEYYKDYLLEKQFKKDDKE